MSNPSKAKGTAAETAVVKWARLNGFPGADRQPLRGNRDAGDIGLCPGIVLEVKNHAGVASVGQPTKLTMTTWMAQCEDERVNADAAHCPLVVKRAGTSDPGRWFAYLPVWSFAELLGAPLVNFTDRGEPLCTSLDTVARILRYVGYGDPIIHRAAS